MGQGQMEIALDLLKKCSSQGSWLCLKNLHLVTPWLTTLEKVTIHQAELFFRIVQS
jgi:dynein heavy chain 2